MDRVEDRSNEHYALNCTNIDFCSFINFTGGSDDPDAVLDLCLLAAFDEPGIQMGKTYIPCHLKQVTTTVMHFVNTHGTIDRLKGSTVNS